VRGGGGGCCALQQRETADQEDDGARSPADQEHPGKGQGSIAETAYLINSRSCVVSRGVRLDAVRLEAVRRRTAATDAHGCDVWSCAVLCWQRSEVEAC
jgi:hypothetical protein